MGTLVGVLLETTNATTTNNNAKDDTPTTIEDEDSYTKILVLDDGTGSHVHCLASDQMAQAVTLGMTLDCVLRNPIRRSSRQPHEHDADSNDSPLVLDMIIIRQEGTQALTLRSLEILHYRQGCPGQTWGLMAHNNNNKHHSESFTMQDINDIIQAEAEMGVSLQDLHEMFRVDKNELQEMIQELQMQGLIYQSKSGAYLPL